MALAVLQDRLQQLGRLDESSPLLAVLHGLPVQDRYDGEMLVTEVLMRETDRLDDDVVFWHRYVNRQQSHAAAGVSTEHARFDRQGLVARANDIGKTRRRRLDIGRDLTRIWGDDVAKLITTDPTVSDPQARAIRRVATVCSNYPRARRQVNQVVFERLRTAYDVNRSGGARSTCPRDWLRLCERHDTVSDAHIPDAWLLQFSLHLDDGGVIRDGYLPPSGGIVADADPTAGSATGDGSAPARRTQVPNSQPNSCDSSPKASPAPPPSLLDADRPNHI